MVGRLVNQSEDQPEKLRELKRRRELAAREVEVVEEVVKDLVKNNKPIYNA